jgi:hypothetical protein
MAGTEKLTAVGVRTVPAARMKAGGPHRVPLSEPALAILHEMAVADSALRAVPDVRYDASGWR